MIGASIFSDNLIASSDHRALLEALPEATLVVAPDGLILEANKSAARALGGKIVGQRLDAIHTGDAGALQRFLRRCEGTTSQLIGSLALQKPGGGKETYRLRGTRLAGSEGVTVLLRVDQQDEERFAELNRKVGALDQEIRERLHMEAVLAETVAQRELLLRELQHRVKNNMHMLQALLHGAEREAESPEAKRALREVTLRVAAINSVQQLLYSSVGLDTIGSAPLAEAVFKGVLALSGERVDTKLEVEPFEIPIDAAGPLALVMNELLTNAVKYGRPTAETQQIDLSMVADGGYATLTIRDNGPGFTAETHRKRSSGIGLVRGLVRQLGGSFEIDGKEGTKCIVRFRLPARSASHGSQ